MPRWINAEAAREELQQLYAQAMGPQQAGGGPAYTLDDHINQVQQVIRDRTPLAYVSRQAVHAMPVPPRQLDAGGQDNVLVVVDIVARVDVKPRPQRRHGWKDLKTLFVIEIPERRTAYDRERDVR